MRRKPAASPKAQQIVRIDHGRPVSEAILREMAANCILVEWPLPSRPQPKSKEER